MQEKPIPQQDFLRDAMRKLSMTRKMFAARLNTSERRLDNWMLPSASKGFRELDPAIWQFVREIVRVEVLKDQTNRTNGDEK